MRAGGDSGAKLAAFYRTIENELLLCVCVLALLEPRLEEDNYLHIVQIGVRAAAVPNIPALWLEQGRVRG